MFVLKCQVHTYINTCTIFMLIIVMILFTATARFLPPDNDVSLYLDVISSSIDLYVTSGEWREGLIRDHGLAFTGGVHVGSVGIDASIQR